MDGRKRRKPRKQFQVVQVHENGDHDGEESKSDKDKDEECQSPPSQSHAQSDAGESDPEQITLRPVQSQPNISEEVKADDREVKSTSLSSLKDIRGIFKLKNQSNRASGSSISSTDSNTSVSKARCSSRSPSEQLNGDETEEEGGHDTLTSLAGAKVIQRYKSIFKGKHRRHCKGDYCSSPSSLTRNNSGSIFNEDFFKPPGKLEDIKEAENDGHENDLEIKSADEPDKLIPDRTYERMSSTTEKRSSETKVEVFEPSNGGFAWIIVISTFSLLFFISGATRSFGIIFKEVLKDFNSSVIVASFIPAVLTSFQLIFAPISTSLCQKYKCKHVALIGGLISSIGWMLSYFSANIPLLTLTLGAMGGIGAGLSASPGIVLTSRYFDRKRSRAFFLILLGHSSGSFILPIVFSQFIQAFDVWYCMLFAGGIQISVCFCALLLRPIEEEHKLNIEKKKRETESLHGQKDEINNSSAEENPLRRNLSTKSQKLCPPKVETSSGKARYLSTQHSRRDSDAVSIASSRVSSNISDSCRISESLPSNIVFEDSEPVSHENLYWTGNGWVNLSKSNENVSFVTSPSGSKFYQYSDSSDPSNSGETLSLKALYSHQIKIFNRRRLSRKDPENLRSNDSSKENNLHILRDRPKHVHGMPSVPFSSFKLEDLTIDSSSMIKDKRYRVVYEVPRRRQTRSVSESWTDRRSLLQQRSIREKNRRRFHSDNSSEPDFASMSQRSFRRYTSTHESENQERPSRPVENASTDVVSSVCQILQTQLDFSLTQGLGFRLIAFSTMLMSMGYPHTLFFLPTVFNDDTGFLLCTAAIGDFLGRISSGALLEAQMLPVTLVYTTAMSLSGVSVIFLSIFPEHIVSLGTLAGLYGLGSGLWSASIPLCLLEFYGAKRMTASSGWLRFFHTFANVLAPILAATVWSVSGDLRGILYFQGTSMILGSVIALFLVFQKPNQTQSDDA